MQFLTQRVKMSYRLTRDRKALPMEIRATSKGQIVIPSSIRRNLGIKEGTPIMIEENGMEIILRPMTRDYIHSLRGKLKGRGLMKALIAEKKREQNL